MNTLSAYDDMLNLVSLVASPIGLAAVGMAADAMALLILAGDIGRVHKEIRNEKIGGVRAAEKELREALDRRHVDLVKEQDALGRRSMAVDTDRLKREIDEIIRWHQMQISLTDAVRVYQGLGSKISTGKSVVAVRVATVLFMIGIAFQVAAQLRA